MSAVLLNVSLSYKSEIEGALAEVERLNEERQVHLNRVKVSEREKAGLEVSTKMRPAHKLMLL